MKTESAKVNTNQETPIDPIQRARIEKLIKLGESKNLKWVGDYFTSTILSTRTLWECPKGHRFERMYQNIGRYGCGKCHRRSKAIVKIQALAKSRKLKLLTNLEELENIDSNTKLTWGCSKGHTWTTTPASIDSSTGSGCPVCFRLKQLGVKGEEGSDHSANEELVESSAPTTDSTPTIAELQERLTGLRQQVSYFMDWVMQEVEELEQIANSIASQPKSDEGESL